MSEFIAARIWPDAAIERSIFGTDEPEEIWRQVLELCPDAVACFAFDVSVGARLGLAESAPDLFRHERRERMQQAQGDIEHTRQGIRRARGSRTALGKFVLRDLHIPVGKVAPDEIVNLLPCLTVLEILEEPLYIANKLL